MNRLIQCLSVLMLLAISTKVQAQDVLIFSEYIEGSSNNKALEIFNPNATAVDLADYQIAQAVNGRDGWEFFYSFPNGSSIPPYGTFVILNSQTSEDVFDPAFANDVLSGGSPVTHNGDDARAIVHIAGTDTTIIDVFGDPDNDPGSGWAVGDSANATQNRTLIRKSSIAVGNNTALGSFGTDDASSEWIVKLQDDFSDLGYHDFDGTPFSVRDLNTYPGLDVFNATNLGMGPFVGEEVTFTGVIISNPKSSGASGPIDDGNDGTIDGVSRIHLFVTDTTAMSRGREGMSIRIVETSYEYFENLQVGDVVTITGEHSFFFATAQFNVTQPPTIVGSVFLTMPEYLPLLDPIEVDVTDLNMFDDGELVLKPRSYEKYNGSYVSITNATVSNITFGTGFAEGRIQWAVNEDGSRIYVEDVSLRYRNDRNDGYLAGWNYRRDAVDGEFTPPPAGALVNISGFLSLNGGNDPDGIYGDSEPFNIAPFEDGKRWIEDNSGTPVLCTDGEFCAPEGGTFEWPNDLTVLGLPPVVSNVALSDSTVESNQAITVTANAEAAEGTLTKVELIYTIDGVADTLAMTNTTGTEFTATIPGQPDLTTVNFRVEATDDSGFVGKAPESGEYSYFVTDTQITTIQFVQETQDGESGPSQLDGVGPVPANITATVTVSAITDGFIAIQDRSAAWSGIFVETGDDADNLEEGDIINVTKFEIDEVFGVTYMSIIEFTETGVNTMMDTLAVTGLLTQDITSNYEPYEGTWVTLSDVKVTTNQADGPGSDFGEFEIGSRQGGGVADTLMAGEGLRYNDSSSRLSSSVNETIKIGATFDAISGILDFSFGNEKLIGGNPAFFDSDDFTLPNPRFALDSPSDNAVVEVTNDVTVEWVGTTDFDGNDVAYEWVLYQTDSTEVVAVPSNSSGEDAAVTLPFATVDGLLAGAGLSVGESADFLWSVRVNDGFDTLNVATSYDLATNSFDTLFYNITLTRGILTNSELENGIPAKFALEQNYPNPFNPSTNINFALPQASRVTLTVYDMLGRKVATLLDGDQLQAANHSVRFDASALASGMYIYRIEAGSFVSTRKMMLIK